MTGKSGGVMTWSDGRSDGVDGEEGDNKVCRPHHLLDKA